jgi:hypothetical protein
MKFISDFRLQLSCLLSVDMMYRVLLLQGGKIFCLTGVERKNVFKIEKKF